MEKNMENEKRLGIIKERFLDFCNEYHISYEDIKKLMDSENLCPKCNGDLKDVWLNECDKKHCPIIDYLLHQKSTENEETIVTKGEK
jgi:hypothetical protein